MRAQPLARVLGQVQRQRAVAGRAGRRSARPGAARGRPSRSRAARARAGAKIELAAPGRGAAARAPAAAPAEARHVGCSALDAAQHLEEVVAGAASRARSRVEQRASQRGSRALRRRRVRTRRASVALTAPSLRADARRPAHDLAALRRAQRSLREAVDRRVAGEEALQHAREQEGAGALEGQLVDARARSRRRVPNASGPSNGRRRTTGLRAAPRTPRPGGCRPASSAGAYRRACRAAPRRLLRRSSASSDRWLSARWLTRLPADARRRAARVTGRVGPRSASTRVTGARRLELSQRASPAPGPCGSRAAGRGWCTAGRHRQLAQVLAVRRLRADRPATGTPRCRCSTSAGHAALRAPTAGAARAAPCSSRCLAVGRRRSWQVA